MIIIKVLRLLLISTLHRKGSFKEKIVILPTWDTVNKSWVRGKAD
jgi:hypothetical protein